MEAVAELFLFDAGASPAIADNEGVTPKQALQDKAARMPIENKLADMLDSHSKPMQTYSGETAATVNQTKTGQDFG